MCKHTDVVEFALLKIGRDVFIKSGYLVNFGMCQNVLALRGLWYW